MEVQRDRPVGARHRLSLVLCKAFVLGGKEALWRWDESDGGRPKKLVAASRSPTHRRLISDGRSLAEDLGNSRQRQHCERPGCSI